MRLAVLGLGYVGCVSMACFAAKGHHVIGVDISDVKIESVKQGKSPIVEPGLEELLQKGLQTGHIEVTSNPAEAVAKSEILIICVGTPSKSNGDLDMSYVERICEDVGTHLRDKETFTVVVIRSTILPGKAKSQILPILEHASGKRVGVDFGFAVNPEFLREGTAIADFNSPPFTLIGALDERSSNQVAELYNDITAPLHQTDLGVAEMVKYASNAFHALKVTYANEIGTLSRCYGIDSHTVMDIFVEDRDLNLSPRYLKPGFAFGGSCLGKDTRALLYSARQADVQVPVLSAILLSNEQHLRRAFDLIYSQSERSVGVIGLSFKPYTDDLRESPSVELVERLIGKGYKVSIYDQEVSLSKLHGSNLAYVDRILPHLATLMQFSLEQLLADTEVIVIAKKLKADEKELFFSCLRGDHIVIDLVRIDGDRGQFADMRYYGLGW